MENMGGGPGDQGAQRPESGAIGQDCSRSPGSGEQAGDDFRGITIQPQIYHRESKGNPEGQVPPRNVELGLDRFSLGQWNRLKLCVHLRPPSESWVIFQKTNKSQDRRPKYRGAFPLN